MCYSGYREEPVPSIWEYKAITKWLGLEEPAQFGNFVLQYFHKAAVVATTHTPSDVFPRPGQLGLGQPGQALRMDFATPDGFFIEALKCKL
jgi:hypothetical protein